MVLYYKLTKGQFLTIFSFEYINKRYEKKVWVVSNPQPKNQSSKMLPNILCSNH